MKKSNIANIRIYLLSSLIFLSVACKDNKQNDTGIERVKIEENISLNKNSESPSCKISIDVDFLNSPKDSVALAINKTINATLLGKQYESLTPKAAVDSFKNAYITSYNNEVGKLYEEDLKSNPEQKNLLSWYNYEYKLSSTITDGKSGILNVKATFFEYSGGAHPNEWGKWMNFSKTNGALLTYSDIFMTSSEKVISKMLLDKLIEYISDKYKDEKVNGINDLNNLGILNESDMYISDNFLVGKDEVSFLYNKYDIAPYSVGSIILSLPYSEVKDYMLK